MSVVIGAKRKINTVSAQTSSHECKKRNEATYINHPFQPKPIKKIKTPL